MTKKPTAFSLIELSIVIVIVAILLTGTLSFSVNNAANDKIKLTNERIKEIYKAMGIFLANSGRLPCPASMNAVDKTSSTYGVEGTCTGTPSGTGIWQSSDTTNYPNIYYGMVPVQTLGLPSTMGEDAFGTRFAYVVLTGFTSATTFGYGYASSATSHNYAKDATYDYTQTSYASYSPTRLIIKEKPLATAQLITHDAMFAIISYGPNKSGGWNSASLTQNTVSTDADEMENDVDSSSGGFDGILISSSPNSDVFDDILFWKTRDQMTMEFDLLSLVACDISFANQITYSRFCPGTSCALPSYNSYSSFAWAANTAVHYGEISPASSGSCSAASAARGASYPTKKCGPFGLWEAKFIDHCLN